MATETLWSFALACYARPDAEQACLALQARGANVCLLLCGLWLERRAIAPDALRLRQLLEPADAWHSEVIEPLRRLRQHWRDAAASDAPLAQLRERVKGLELQAERELLDRLGHLTEPWQPAAAPATWLERLIPPAAQDAAALLSLRNAAAAV